MNNGRNIQFYLHEQIEASDRHPLLDNYLKNFFDIKINGNNSIDDYNDKIKKSYY